MPRASARTAAPKRRARDADPDEAATRQRLLDAAGAVFAEVGFASASVRDICARANANVAAIKYHFGGKFPLYQAVFSYWFERARERYPVEMGQAEARGDRERLRAFLAMMLGRLIGPGKPAWHGRLIAREMSEPSGVLEHALETMIRPIIGQLRPIVQSIVGPLPQVQFERALHSVIAQCVFYQHARPVLERAFPAHLQDPDLDAMADHIATFSYAGLRALRRRGRRKP